jgi:hypothetical protein
MQEHNIATVINYCTLDSKWLRPCVEHVKDFSKQIIVTALDHLYNGILEDQECIEKSKKENPEAEFVEFEWNPSLYEGAGLQRLNDPFAPIKYMIDIKGNEAWFWDQMSRLMGFNQVRDDIEYVLFIDTDEITDPIRFTEWLNTFPYRDYSSIRFDSYFYFLQTKYQSLITEEWNGITLLKKSELQQDVFFKHDSCRLNFVNFMPGNKATKTEGLDGRPMFHHYSWVRNKEEMLKKVVSWAHHKDRDWTSQVLKEFERQFNPMTDKCFVHGYDYITIKPYMEI